MLTFNELDGMEVMEILQNRCRQIFEQIPQFKRHITLPRVKMTLNVKLEIWADQPHPETMNIGDSLTIVLDQPKLVETYVAQSIDNAAPGGNPPDKIREMHGLPISKPERGNRETGGQIAFADSPVETQGGQLPGISIEREGGQTTVWMDNGPAGLAHGRMERDRITLSRGVPAKP
jgi:hypothetical protein